MLHRYGQFDGQTCPTPESLFPAPKVIQFILQYGQKALDAMEQLHEDEEKQYIQAMIDAGLLERDEQTGELRLTPRMLRGIENRALMEVFEGLGRGTREGHPTLAAGRSDERADGTKPYEFGDPVSELDLAATMRNTLRRARHERASDAAAGIASPDATSLLPLPIRSDDFEIHLSEGQADVAMCMLLDMSGSMMRYGRFYQAKRVALGMAALMRGRYPRDTLDYVGFYSTACRLAEKDLPLVMPKPVTIYDHQVRVHVPLAEAEEDPRRVPQHFTNLQLGLRLARRILARRPAANKIIFIITDGQPTAHVEPGPGGEMLHLLYPPSERTSTLTLQEALRCKQEGVDIATFALIEDYYGMDWVSFVDHLTRLTRGVAFYCTSEDLSSTVIESYLRGKRKKTFVA